MDYVVVFVSWGLAAVNNQIVGDLVVAGQASFVARSLNRARVLFLQSNSKAHGHSVTHEMSIDHSVQEVSHTHLVSCLTNCQLATSCDWVVVNLEKTDPSVIANKQQSGTANLPKHESEQGWDIANEK